MPHPLMPKATAVWLIDNTTLTFKQIADFCGLHELEVQAIADAEVAFGMHALNPITAGALTTDEIKRCEAESTNILEMAKIRIPEANRPKKKVARYTPVAKRQDRPDGISWLLKNYPEITDAQISKLIGTTKPTINSIRDRTHWNSQNITPQNPVSLGLCSSNELEKILILAKSKKMTSSDAPVPEDTPKSIDIPIENLSPEDPVDSSSKDTNYSPPVDKAMASVDSD